jgi:hypothetical protein
MKATYKIIPGSGTVPNEHILYENDVQVFSGTKADCEERKVFEELQPEEEREPTQEVTETVEDIVETTEEKVVEKKSFRSKLFS